MRPLTMIIATAMSTIDFEIMLKSVRWGGGGQSFIFHHVQQ